MKQSLGTTAYTVSKLKKVWIQWHRRFFYLNWKKENYECLASALLMKKHLVPDINLLLFISFLRSSGKSLKHL